MRRTINAQNKNYWWLSYSPIQHYNKNKSLFESLNYNSEERYNNYINFKFNKFQFGKSYNYYQKSLYEALNYSYDPNKFVKKLYDNNNVAYIQFGYDEYGEFPDQLYVYCYQEDLDNLKEICEFFGYYIATYYTENSKICYIIESKFGITEMSEQIYNDFNGICYHITDIKNLEKIKKIGLYTKSKSKKVFHPERIYLASGFNNDTDAKNILNDLANELYPNSHFIILKINLKKNNFKCKLMMDHAYMPYGIFTYENINPKCISEI